MLTRILLLFFVFSASFVVAQDKGHETVKKELQVCTPQPGGCAYNLDNVSIGVGAWVSQYDYIQFLPGEYSSSVVQTFLINVSLALNLSSETPVVPTPGYNLSSVAPPFNVTLQPGFTTFGLPLYNGPSNFTPTLESFANRTNTLDLFYSIAVASDVFLAISYGVSEYLLIIYHTAPVIPFITSPPTAQSITLKDFQSTTCQPPCTSYGVCIASGKCVCDKGFTGSSCELCDTGFNGTACKPCPSECKSCDQNGKCLTPTASNVRRAQKPCICQNGQCINGKCVCLPGWNGDTCNQCAPGFSLASNGTTNTTNCQSCELGCSNCDNITRICRECYAEYSKNPNDNTKCDISPTKTKDSTCPPGTFGSDKGGCVPCPWPCSQCDGGTKNNCTACHETTSMYKGLCVNVDPNTGVCAGTNGMIANNDKGVCDACGANCTECAYKKYSQKTLFKEAVCKKCLNGTILSDGICTTQSCPDGQFYSGGSCLKCSENCATCNKIPGSCTSCGKGQFLSGSTCNPCSNGCASCANSPGNCTSCEDGQFLSKSSCKQCSKVCATCSGTADHCTSCITKLNGDCIDNCPDGYYREVDGNCNPCFADCAACTGGDYNQCTDCFPSRPVFDKDEKRCYLTCKDKNQYFNQANSSCDPCDPSCSSCYGAGPNNCLACSDLNQVLQNNGSCSSPPPHNFGYLGANWTNTSAQLNGG